MRTTKSLCLAALAAAGLALAAGGQEFRTDINPAFRYYQAFITTPRYSQAFSVAPNLTVADYDYLFTNQWWGKRLPDRFGQIISNYDAQFTLVRQAAQATVPCDWGIDSSAGPYTLLPHLAQSKAVAVTASLRALWELQNGRETEACDDLLAAFTLGRNTSRDGTVVGSLVQFADEAIVLLPVAENFGRFSPQTLRRFVEGLDAAPTGADPREVFLDSKKLYFVGWLERKIAEWRKESAGDDAAVLAKVRQVDLPDNGGTDGWEAVIAAAGGTSEGILKLLQAQEPLYEEGAEILALPYAAFQDRAAEFKAKVEAVKSANPVARITFPDVLRGKRSQFKFKMQAWLAMVHGALAYKVQGEQGLSGVNDPCGSGPFQYQRFEFEGVDRGFKLTSAFTGSGFPEALIFVEREGKPFLCDGPYIGQGREPLSK